MDTKTPTMTRCPSCDYMNPDRARFCLECGARLSPPVEPIETPPEGKSIDEHVGFTAAQKAIILGLLLVAILVIGVVAYDHYNNSSNVAPVASQTPNMKITVETNLCWSGSVGGTGNGFSVSGCGYDSWSFPNQAVVSGVIQFHSAWQCGPNAGCNCSNPNPDPSTGTLVCPGSLEVIVYHTNGNTCNQASTSAEFGVVDVACSES